MSIKSTVTPELGELSISHQLLKWAFHVTPVAVMKCECNIYAYLILVCHTCSLY